MGYSVERSRLSATLSPILVVTAPVLPAHDSGIPMFSPPNRRKPDLVVLLILFVAVGMAVTLAVQISLDLGGDPIPIARQTLPPGGVDG